MMISKHLSAVFVCLSVFLLDASLHVKAFAPLPCSRAATSRSNNHEKKPTATRFPFFYHTQYVVAKSTANYRTRDTSLYQAAYLDGSNGRGLVILTLALSICVWSFTIPPELRREHICTTTACVEQRSKCYDCVTFNEWTEQVASYYRNGGGVKFDFSIDPETLEFWASLKE